MTKNNKRKQPETRTKEELADLAISISKKVTKKKYYISTSDNLENKRRYRKKFPPGALEALMDSLIEEEAASDETAQAIPPPNEMAVIPTNDSYGFDYGDDDGLVDDPN